MRFQSNSFNCGPAALRNALLCLGIKRSEEELEGLTGMTADGTTAVGMLKALKAISAEHPEVTPAVIQESRGDVALLRLLEAVRSTHPVIVCTDGWDHWAVAFGLLGLAGAGLKIHVADSGSSELVLHYTPGEFLRIWEGPGKKAYYGIIV